YVLWVELPPQVDAMKLYSLALAQRITVGPGHMFSAGADYRHFIRLNYSYPWSRQIDPQHVPALRLRQPRAFRE
ncbi:hypothetical protein QM306_37995, partial [Burkholderia cenocepacia]|nr:hypothetical protein [Burkholderia cenocepacia]